MTNFLDPAILFFIFGVFAGSVKSNLEIPPQISRFLSLYLLMALGLKGGFALHKSGFTSEIAFSLGLAVFLAIIIPMIGYALLRRTLNAFDAAAIHNAIQRSRNIWREHHRQHDGAAVFLRDEPEELVDFIHNLNNSLSSIYLP